MNFRRLFISLSAILAALLLTCCNSSYYTYRIDPKGNHHRTAPAVVKSGCPVFFSETLPQSDLVTALKTTFPNQVPLANASIAFFSPDAPESAYMGYYNDGGFVMFCDINDAAEARFASLFPDMDNIPESDNDIAEGGVDNLMLYGFNIDRYEFWMPWPFKNEEADYSRFPVTSDTGSERPDPNDPDDPENTFSSEPTSISEYNADAILLHLDELADWADRGDFRTYPATSATKASSQDEPLNLNLLGQQHHFVYPIGIDAYIDKATWSDPDWLKKYSEIVGDVTITPAYASGANDSGVAGDYYIVDMEITVKSGAMWGPEQHSHGGCNNRIIGFYLEQLYLQAKLTDKNGEPLPDVRFMPSGGPEPSSNMGSTNHTETSTYGLTIGVSPGYKWGGSNAGFGLNGNISFNASWTKTTTRTLQDVQVTLDTPNSEVRYHLDVHNINNERDWDNVGKDIATHYPEVCRSDMKFTCAWVWFIPSSTNASAGVEDGSDTNFNLNLILSPKYGAFSWWRGASWDRELHFCPNQPVTQILDGKKKETLGDLFLGDIDLPTPNRARCGFIELTNMSSQYTLTDVKIRRSVEGQGADQNQFNDVPGAVNQNKFIRIPAQEGKYDILYTFVDPNTNQKISTYQIPGIEIKQGRNQSESTTKVSSTQGIAI